MKLNYVLGRTGRGKTEYILEQIKTLVDQDKLCRVMVIVPEQATFRMERDLIEKCNLPGLFNLSVVSFDRLVHEILSATGGRTLSPLDFIGKTMVVRSLLDQHREALSVFGKSAGMPGFEIKMTEMLTEFKRQDVALPDLARTADMSLEPVTQQKLSDIALLYTAYTEKLSDQRLDSEDMISLAIEKAEETNFFNGAHVFVDGFDLLTSQLLRLLMTTIQQAANTTISFRKNTAASSDNMVFSPEEALYTTVSESAKAMGIKPNEIPLTAHQLEETKYTSTEILHLEQNLFSYPFVPFLGAPKDIHLSAFDSQGLEVKSVCAQIIRLVEGGIRFRDIALCVSDIDVYREALSFALNENSIPFFMDAKTKLMDTAFAEFLISLLDFLMYKDTADFIVHIKSGFLDIPQESLFAVENHIRRYQLKGYMLNYAFKNADTETEKARKTLTDPVFELMRSLKSAKTAESYGEDILTYLKACHVDETIEAFAKALEEGEDFTGAQVFSQVFEKISEIIHQACVMFQGQAVSFESFVSAIKAGLEAVEIAVIPPSTDDILVGDFSRTAFPPVKALFILGLNDGKIPTVSSASAILTDAEKLSLEKQGLRAGYRDRFFEERIRIYSVFSGPTQQLFLSYLNCGGKAADKPSVLVGRLQKIFPNLSVSAINPLAEVYPKLSKESLLRDLSFSLNQKLEGLTISPAWHDVYASFLSDPAWQPRIARILSRLKKTEKTELIEPKLAEQLYSPLTASITRVEKFYTCPMQYFLNYGIRLKKDELFEETTLEMGNFLHDCLQHFVKQIKEKSLQWGTLDDKKIGEISSHVLVHAKKTHNHGIFTEKRYAPIFERLSLDFTSAVHTIRDQLCDTAVSVYAAELTLKDTEYLKFSLENGAELRLTCKVDRVDTMKTENATAVRIVDYKLSGKPARLTDVYFGLNIQLLIYLKFVLEYFKTQGENVIIGGAFYYDLSLPFSKNIDPVVLLKEKRMNGFMVDSADINAAFSKLDGTDLVATQGSISSKTGEMNRRTKTIFNEQEFNTLFAYCENLMKKAFCEILSGQVTPLPYKDGQKTACENCDYQSICLFDADLDAYRVVETKDIQDFSTEE